MSSFCFSYQSNRFYHNSEAWRFPTLKSRFSSILYIYPDLHPASAFLRLAQDAVVDNLAISSHSQRLALLQLIADIFLQAAIDEDLLFPEEFCHLTPGQLRPRGGYRIDPPGSNIQHDLLQMRRKPRNRTGGNTAAHCGNAMCLLMNVMMPTAVWNP